MTDTSTPVRLWTNRRYLLWLISDTAKGLGTSLFSFAIPLVALFITDDPAQAGVIGGIGMTVRLVFTLIGGVLADRHHRIVMMLIGAVVGIVLGAGFLLLALADALTFATLLIVEVLMCIRAGAFEPAAESALKQLVPDAAMGRAQAANQGRDAALQLAGGPLGGVLLAGGAWLIGLVMAACYALSAATAALLLRLTGTASPEEDERDADAVDADAADAPVADAAAPVNPAAKEHPARAMFAELREAFTWLFSRADLGGVLIIITIINLGFNATITTVIYALQQAGHSEVIIGMLSAAVGAVMLVGAVIAPVLVPRLGAGTLTVMGLAAATLGAGALALVHAPWTIFAVVGASVFLLPSLNAAMLGYFMVATPSRMLGRANSAAGVLSMGAMPLAPLIAGIGLALVGRTTTILVCAALCAIALVLALANRPLRSLPAEAGWAEHARQFETAGAAGR